MCSTGKKPFSVDLVAQLFQPASNWVETVEKALVATAVVFTGAYSCYLLYSTAHVTLLVNKKDGVRVAHPVIHFYDNFF